MPHYNHTEFVFIRFFMYVCKNKDIYCKIIIEIRWMKN